MEKIDLWVIKPSTLYEIRQWERSNLPHYAKEVGYQLFLELARHGGINQDTLKSFYLSMPYSESTVRLLLRQLEEDGWIKCSRQASDNRSRQIDITAKFVEKQQEWLGAVTEILNRNMGI